MEGRDGPRCKRSPFEDYGRSSFTWEHYDGAAACEAPLGGWNKGLPQALARGGQAGFRMAWPEGGRIRGRLLLAWLPLQIPSSHEHGVLAEEDRGERAPGPPRGSIAQGRRMDCNPDKGVLGSQTIQLGSDHACGRRTVAIAGRRATDSLFGIYNRGRRSDNEIHPRRPTGSNWRCPVGGCPQS